MSFVANTLVVLRESLEAFLVVGVMAGLVTRCGAPAYRRHVYAGAAAGIVASLAVGWAILQAAQNLRETYEELFAGVASLAAVAVLTYMVVWMRSHTTDLLGGMQGRLRAAIDRGAHGVLVAIPFVAVLREGFETVLFLAVDAGAGTASLLGAVLLGLAGAAGLGALLFAGILRLNVRRFFAATGGLLVLFAAWMLQYGVHELGEVAEARAHELGELLEGPLAWAAGVAYLLAMGGWYLRPLLTRAASPAPPAPDSRG